MTLRKMFNATIIVILCGTAMSLQAQTQRMKLYPAHKDWLTENHFPISDYDWNFNPVNHHLCQAIEKKSLDHLIKATEGLMDYSIGGSNTWDLRFSALPRA